MSSSQGYGFDINFYCSSGQSIEAILLKQRTKFLPADTSKYQRIIVRRRHLFEDALHRFRSGVDFHKYIHVTFIGEPAVDAGGPLREFLRLLMEEIASNNSLFSGADEHRVPAQNMSAFEKQTYRYIGQMIAVSLIHGGPAPTFLAPSVVGYILKGIRGADPQVKEVPNLHVRQKLEEVCIMFIHSLSNIIWLPV